MISKEKLLRYFDEYIQNSSYGLIDYELSDEVSPMKDETLKVMKAQHERLKDLRKQLEGVIL